MKTGAKWAIGLGVGIPGVLILIGLIVLIIKFFMKRCRKRAWEDITTLPRDIDAPGTGISHRILSKRRTSERQPLNPSSSNNILEVSDGHITIQIDDHDISPNQPDFEKTNEPEQSLVQIQRDRLNRLKEENRLRPMIRLNNGAEDIQRAIDEAQKEFDESL